MNHDRSKNIMPSCTILNRSRVLLDPGVEVREVLRRGQVGKPVAGEARLRRGRAVRAPTPPRGESSRRTRRRTSRRDPRPAGP